MAGLFPDVDWLIGNHSDELTPWIPVMAARYCFMFAGIHVSLSLSSKFLRVFFVTNSTEPG